MQKITKHIFIYLYIYICILYVLYVSYFIFYMFSCFYSFLYILYTLSIFSRFSIFSIFSSGSVNIEDIEVCVVCAVTFMGRYGANASREKKRGSRMVCNLGSNKRYKHIFFENMDMVRASNKKFIPPKSSYPHAVFM